MANFNFFYNVLTTLKVTFPYLFGVNDKYKAITEEYPDKVSARMPEDLPPKYRGFLVNDTKKCTGCEECVRICPANCIKFIAEERPDGKRHIACFEIDKGKCIHCGLCVEVCEPESLKHTTQYEGAVIVKEELLENFGEGFASEIMKKRWEEEQKNKVSSQGWSDDI